jgi:hypothetical protein
MLLIHIGVILNVLNLKHLLIHIVQQLRYLITNRIIKGTFTIKLFGYIVPDTIQKDVTAIKKYNSKAQVIITAEVVNNLNSK